jgi:transcriptional regulator with XRE-family HTH domain
MTTQAHSTEDQEHIRLLPYVLYKPGRISHFPFDASSLLTYKAFRGTVQYNLIIYNALYLAHCQEKKYKCLNYALFFMINFGERIKKVREIIGLDQKAFGVSIGVAGRDTISRWERGLGFPSANILANMRQKYRINIDWLLSGDGEPFIEGWMQEKQAAKRGKLAVIDPVVQLFNAEVERTGLILIPEQRTAILKILREFVHRDVRLVRELIRSIHAGRQGNGL